MRNTVSELTWRLALGAAALLSVAGCGSGANEPQKNAVAAPPVNAPNQARSAVPPGTEPLSDEEMIALGRPSPPKLAKRPAVAPGAEPILESENPNSARPSQPAPRGTSPTAPGAEPNLDASETIRQAAPSKPEFPNDLAQWTAENYRSARQNRNPRLVHAVRQLARGNRLNPDAQQNARLLGELLKPPADAARAGATAAGVEVDPSALENGAGSMSGLAAVIVETLGENGGSEARAVLKRILLGNQPSEEPDRTLTTLAFRAIVGHPDEENQRILLAVLAAADSIRPPGRGQMTADELQQECLRQVRPIATAEFRLKLAQRIVKGVSSAASRQRLLALLTTSDPSNLAALVELTAGNQIDPAKLAAIDGQLSPISQQVLETLLRTAPGQSATVGNSPIQPTTITGAEDVAPVAHEMSNADNMQLARQFWRDDFGKQLAQRIEASDNLQTEPTLAALAGNIPSDSVRSAFARRWQRSWVGDASWADSSPLFTSGIRDPGLLVVLKESPRATPSAKLQAATKSTAKSNDSLPPSRSAKELAARLAWLHASEVFVRSLADSLATVADSRSHGAIQTNTSKPVGTLDDFDKLADGGATDKAPINSATNSIKSEVWPSELGVSPHAGARVKTGFSLNWPADLQGHLDVETSPLVIHFVRLTSEGQIDAVANSYSRQLKSSILRTTDNGRWVDVLTKLDDGRVRSIDVLVNRVDNSQPPARGTSEKLTVDLLSIEIVDPQPPSVTENLKSAENSNVQR